MVSDDGGNDTFSFAAATVPVTFVRGVTAACPSGTCATNGTNQVTNENGQIENFVGGSAADTFILTHGSSLSGSINGNGGTDTLDLSAATTALNLVLTGLGSVDGFNGTVTGLGGGFSNLDVFLSGTGSDKLTGMNTASLYTISNSGNTYRENASGRIFSFSGVESLQGGSAADTFAFVGSAALGGSLNGGAGTDTLDYSAATVAVSVSLSSGTATGVPGGIASIENVLGSPVANTIYGDNNDNVLVGTSGNDKIYGLGGNDTLIGLGGDDLLDGGAGIDTVDYSGNLSAGVTINLSTGLATSSDSGTDTLVSIENIIGSSFADNITGNSGDNVIDGRGGNDRIEGGTGNDTYVFGNDWGQDVLTDAGGTDTITFAGETLGLQATISAAGLSVTDGTNLLTVNGASIENLLGSQADDVFRFSDGASLSGTLDGREGQNVLDFSTSTTTRTFTLSAQGSLNGFKGTVSDALPTGFDNISGLVGSSASDSLLGLNQNADWNLNDAGNTYSSGGRTLSFAGIENLNGGSGNDVFHLIGAGSLAGNLSGGTGTNRLDYSAYTAGPVAVNMQTSTATALGGTFSGISSLTGSDSVSTTLVGSDSGNTFNINAANSGTLNGSFTFANVANLVGGSGSDAFVFANGATLSGSLAGLAGTDTLDYRADTTGLTIDLAAGTALANGVTTLVSGIENVISGKGNDSITGDSNDNVFTDTGGTDVFDGGDGNDTYVFEANWGSGDVVTGLGGTDTMTFAGLAADLNVTLDAGGFTVSDGINSVSNTGYQIENLVTGSGNDTFTFNAPASINLNSGAGNDTFRFTSGSSLTGNLDGGSGTNTLDYSAFGRAIVANLDAHTITGITGTISNINALTGSALADTLVGSNSGATFNITGSNSGNVDGLFAFSGIENLQGGSGSDIFRVADGGSLSGSVDGVSGSDTLTFAGSSLAHTLNITSTSTDGFAGAESHLGAGFTNIDTLLGGNGSDVFTGADAPSTYAISTSSTYTLGGKTLSFSGFETVNGGAENDLFIITGANNVSLNGNGGADQFVFGNGASVQGGIDGGTGADVLDLSAYTTPRSVTLTGLGDIDGFNGNALVLGGAFRNINVLRGGAGAADTLTGMNAAAVFDLAAGTYTSTNTLSYSGFENLVGGSDTDVFLINGSVSCNLNGGAGNDEFVFNATHALTGAIDGGSGADMLNYFSYDADVNVNFALGTATGVSGGIKNMENFTGSALHTNTITGDDNDNVLVGGSSNDILIGGKGNDTYIFTNGWGHDVVVEKPGEGNDTIYFGTVTNDLNFTFDGSTVSVSDGTNTLNTGAANNVENFVGGLGNDTFTLKNGAVVNGQIDGGAGSNTLDTSAYGSARSFVLTRLGTAVGFAGSEASLHGGFDNISALIGTSLSGDSLTGLNAAAEWNLTGTTVENYTSGGRTLDYSAIENLVGGSAADTFVFANGADHTGSVNGAAGSDTLDYSAYTSSVTVDLAAFSASGISGLVTGIENVRGGSAADSLSGDENANHLEGNGGNDTLNGRGGNDVLDGGLGDDTLAGGTGDDRYVFNAGWGSDNVIEADAEGNDTLDFSAISAALTITLDALTVTDGSNWVSHSGAGIENIQSGSGNDLFNINSNRAISLYGGAGNDTYVFSDGVTLNGSIDGQSGSDWLDFSAFTTARNVVLTGLGSVDGFNGLEASLTGSFANIDTITATSSHQDTFTGANLDANFAINGNVIYTSTGHTLTANAFETLNGGAGSDTFDVSGAQTYNLNGGAGDDVFRLENDATLTGTIDGQSGSNTLDFSPYTTSRDIILTGTGSLNGFAGIEFSIIGTFDNINRILGGSGDDSLSGTNDPGVWTVTPTGGSYTSASRTLTFASIETLSGSGYDDTFIIKNGVTLPGSIDGRGGTDTLDFSDFLTDLEVTLENGYVNVFHGGVTSIENVIGGAGNDILVGDDNDNVIDGGAGNNILAGEGGDDTLWSGTGYNILYGGDGNDTAYIAAGGTYIVPLNDIENLLAAPGPEPQPVPVPVTGSEYAGSNKKQPTVIVIDIESGDQTTLFFAGYLAALLRLPEGNEMYFGFLNGEVATLAYFDTFTLEKQLPEDTALVFGIAYDLSHNGVTDTGEKAGTTLSFVVPQGYDPQDLMIARWNSTTKKWEEIASSYVPELKTVPAHCEFDPRTGEGDPHCLFTPFNQTGIIGHRIAVVTVPGEYVLLVKAKSADLTCTTGDASLDLGTTGVAVPCSGAGEVKALPVAVWTLHDLPADQYAVSGLQFYTKVEGQVQPDLAEGQTATLSFDLPQNVTGTYQVLYRADDHQAWTVVSGATQTGDTLQVQVSQPGTYVLMIQP